MVKEESSGCATSHGASGHKTVKAGWVSEEFTFYDCNSLGSSGGRNLKKSTPEVCNKKSIREATKQNLVDSGYGDVITKVPVVCRDGSTRDLVIANPLALLLAAYSQGGAFYSLAQSTMLEKPCSLDCCWKAIFYMDEVQPGNQLGVHQGRKCWVCYFSLEEFGPVHLQKEAAWFTLLVERTTKVQELHAGV